MSESEATPSTQAPSTLAPRQKEVGGFEIISKLGQGGMGAVFKARQKSLDRIVALKILPPSIAKDASFIERFQREARASAKLNHPNIVQGIDVGKDAATGLWYFAMEYVDGPSLNHLLKEQKTIPEKRALEIVRDIARALECAGHNGIVHRDVKPDNILLTQRGEAKLADLGLAKQLTDDASLTQSGQSVGTPNYMAPEQARGAINEIDIRTDIYALGGTLFHLVTGRTPFTGETSAVIMTKHLTEPAPKARSVNPEVSEACSRLISRMMQKKLEQRVQNPATVIQQIDDILSGADTAAPKSEGGARRARHDTTGPRTPVGETKSAAMKWAVLALPVLAIVGFLALRSKPQTTVAEATPETRPPQEVVSKKETPKPAPAVTPAPVSDRPLMAKRPAPVPTPAPATTPAPAPADTSETVAKKTPVTDPVAPVKVRPAVEPDKPSPAEVAAKEAAAAQAAEAATNEAKANKAAEMFAAVLKETAPMLAQNKYTDALSLLDQKISSSSLADARDLLKQEKADVQAIQELRKQAVDAIRKMSGKTVSLKKGNAVFSGKVIDESKPDCVTLKVANGPELTLNSDQLHIQDVDTYAENATPEDLRRRGLLFLAVGDKDNLVKAKMNFIRARDGGSELAGKSLERIAALEMGEVEVAAEKAWSKAESIFAEKRLKEADEAYAGFQQKFAKTKVHFRNAELLASRLKAIEKASKPEVSFRADESMKMFPDGHQQGIFPKQVGQDPLAPFENKAAYFQQRTGTDVVYDVRSYRPLKQLRWKGAAMQKMTIEILDAKGAVLTSGGPYEGGNNWAEFTVNFEPRKEFVIRLRNHVSMWYFISEIELK